MKRREFLTAASGAGAVAASASAATASSAGDATPTPTPTGTPGNATANGTATKAGKSTPEIGGSVEPDFGGWLDGVDGGYEDLRGKDEVTVKVGADGNGGTYAFSPAGIWISKGTKVTFEWVSNTHNIVPESQPSGAGWGGVSSIHNSGYTYEATFETGGIFTYFCQPHKGQGMKGAVAVGPEVPTVETGGGGGGGGGAGGGGGEKLSLEDIEEMGVPFQAHFVGLATGLAVLNAIIFTFFVLKYGTSPNASGGSD